MLVGIFADIHANREAFEACLTQALSYGVERFALLGDYVGYGADPEWTLDTVMQLTAQGAPAVLGNHDSAVNNSETMNIEAQVAIEWTRGVLSAPQRQFLADLPYTRTGDDVLFVHAEASNPERWIYVRSTLDAARSLSATSAHVTFCGHVHQPGFYCKSATGKMTAFTPVTDVPMTLMPGRRWLAVLGSVGQPRDGNPASSYVTFDTERQEITYRRAPYDVESAAAKIIAKGLPTFLAERLFQGR